MKVYLLRETKECVVHPKRDRRGKGAWLADFSRFKDTIGFSACYVTLAGLGVDKWTTQMYETTEEVKGVHHNRHRALCMCSSSTHPDLASLHFLGLFHLIENQICDRFAVALLQCQKYLPIATVFKATFDFD